MPGPEHGWHPLTDSVYVTPSLLGASGLPLMNLVKNKSSLSQGVFGCLICFFPVKTRLAYAHSWHIGVWLLLFVN